MVTWSITLKNSPWNPCEVYKWHTIRKTGHPSTPVTVLMRFGHSYGGPTTPVSGTDKGLRVHGTVNSLVRLNSKLEWCPVLSEVHSQVY